MKHYDHVTASQTFFVRNAQGELEPRVELEIVTNELEQQQLVQQVFHLCASAVDLGRLATELRTIRQRMSRDQRQRQKKLEFE